MSQSTPETRRIVIVGGGVAGLSTAALLAQSGMPVTLLETSQLGHGASTRNQGWLHSGGIFAPDRAAFARNCYEAFQQTVQFCPEALEPGIEQMVYLFSRPETLVTRWTSAWTELGIPFEEIPLSKVLGTLPLLETSTVRSAFRLPDRSVNSDSLLRTLAAVAQDAGAEIQTQTAIVRLLREEDRVAGVVTGTGEEISAQLVILATGAGGSTLWSDLHQNHVGGQPQYTLVPLKAHLVAYEPGIGSMPFCVVDEEAFCHLPHGTRSVFGSNRWSQTGHAASQVIEPLEMADLEKKISQFLPGLTAEPVSKWAGTTVQAMEVTQIEPGIAMWPAVIDYAREPCRVENLLSIFPGRATLWPKLAEDARQAVISKIDWQGSSTTSPPWGTTA